MQIEITPEALLTQLKLNVNAQSLDQMHTIIQETKGAKQFFKHLFSLNDNLAPLNAFVAPSSSTDRLKIKFHGDDKASLSDFHQTVTHWSQKYKVELEKLEGKETYYIKGLAS